MILISNLLKISKNWNLKNKCNNNGKIKSESAW